jgi:hypothetical protein
LIVAADDRQCEDSMSTKCPHTIRLPVPAAAMLACCVLPGMALAEGPRFTLGAGAEYTTGDYGGDESVDEFYLPITATLDLERVSFRLTVPYLSVRAPELTTITGPDGQPVVGEGPRVTESGIGDVLAAVTLFDALSSSSGDLAMDVTGKVKFGTADVDQGLGTGEQDYSLQADVYRFFEQATVMGTLGYALRGDPADYDLSDTFFASVGTSYAIADGMRIGAFFDFREASVPDSDDLQELSAWISTRLGENGRAQFYVLGGLGDSSPDWGAGLSFSMNF